jgi:hypothetical protein
VTAAEEMLARELFSDRPFGSFGELITPQPPGPLMPGTDERPRFPPPPWSEHYVPELDPEPEPAVAEEEIPSQHPPPRREPA